MNVTHPAARMLVELSQSQDIEAGDGTTSVVVLCGSMLSAASDLLERGLHPQIVADGFLKALSMAEKILIDIAQPIDLTDKEGLNRAVATSLQSKVVSSLASHLAPIAVEASLRVIKDIINDRNFDIRDIRVVKQYGGTVDDSELVDGLVLQNQRVTIIAKLVENCISDVQNCRGSYVCAAS